MNICLVGAELFNADRRTDRQNDTTDITQLIVAFRNFANASKTREFYKIHTSYLNACNSLW